MLKCISLSIAIFFLQKQLYHYYNASELLVIGRFEMCILWPSLDMVLQVSLMKTDQVMNI